MEDSRWNILLIEDDEDDYVLTMEMLVDVLGTQFHLDWSATYADGLVVLMRSEHDLCLTDYRLGSHDGIELVREAHARGCHTPIIVLTGQGDQTVDVEAVRTGAADYLIKGQTSAQQLERAIRHAIERSAERRQAEAVLRARERYFRALIEYAADSVVVLDAAGVEQYTSPSTERLLGYALDERQEQGIFQLVHLDDRHMTTSMLAGIQEHPGSIITSEIRVLHKDGGWRWLECTARNLLSDPSVAGIVCNIRDVTDRNRYVAQLSHQALHDPLTELPNRTLLQDRLGHALVRAQREHRSIALLFLDLDNFKRLNDSIGYATGDAVLREVSTRLRGCLRDEDTVACLGGDEFALLLEGVTTIKSVLEVTERLLVTLSVPHQVDGHELIMTGSIGIALSGSTARDALEMVRNADAALFRAKQNGRARYEMFDPELYAQALARLEMESDLRRAIAADEFVVYYQPQVELASGRIVGLEALVRWQHPVRGFISPADFIPLAEETGLIVELGQWVIEESCRQAYRWQQQYPGSTSLRICANLSARQFRHPLLVQEIARAIQTSGVDPTAIELELTESVLMEDAAATIATLKALKALGVRLAVDDFGTGYSSLAYLKRFPVSTLKIDRTFVARFGVDEDDTAIVRMVIALAKTLGLEVVAEGVETAEQVAQLRAIDCTMGQGFYYSQPLPSNAASTLLAADRARER